MDEHAMAARVGGTGRPAPVRQRPVPGARPGPAFGRDAGVVVV